MIELIVLCTADMESVSESGKMGLDMQVRAYDLLQALSESAETGSIPSCEACGHFLDVYEMRSEKLRAIAFCFFKLIRYFKHTRCWQCWSKNGSHVHC